MTARIIITALNHSFPRLAGIADDAAAWRLYCERRDLSDVAIQSKLSANKAAGQSLSNESAADLGGAR